MPKAKAQKWYAVQIGRDGPQIYDNWNDCKDKVSRYPGAVHKSFKTRKEAENWLGDHSSKELKKEFFQPHGSAYRTKEKSPSQKLLPEAKPQLQPSAAIVLSPEQTQVLDRVKAGQNVFFTGSAGTGKSVLLREIISFCGGSHSPEVAITASTGIASVNIGGTTLHSWAGIGIGNESAAKLVGKFWGQPKFRPVLERWQRVRTLIIDEISMLDGSLFDTLEEVARRTRRNDLPFGGIQLVLCGDFCQLPPVSGRNGPPAKFAFEADCWDTCVPTMMHLTRVFRQKDQAFVDMLNEMRLGNMKPATIQAFRSLSRKVTYKDGIEPTELYSTRREVDQANKSRLNQLQGEARTYAAQDIPGRDADGRITSPAKMEQLLDRLLAPKSITLKVGAQVMLVKNIQQGRLVNGSVGTVIKFMSVDEAAKEHVTIAEAERPSDNEKTKAGTRESPINVDDFESGEDEEDDIVIVSESANAPLPATRRLMLWPLVRFVGGIERMVIPADFTVNNAEGEVEAKRIQIPLILSWALSVHKSQGQTLERVKVDLKQTFEKGQAYVALSRATSMDHLQVLNFEASKVEAHPLVLHWYRTKAGSPASLRDEFDDFDDEMDSEEAMQAYYDL
ncbi:DNA repair and recombination protein pif1 [Coprinopsis cinerea okayama7|uniref:ATP-dependent DNA helicase PIF1 n=1 Tax=Coprinopsis cinerea (strain Okayama-7 / 130 / ATCC MYA-4618 / FGSC 9003) TaxID=240176 RepID=D6RJX6_COPC7|nr:DNA repair and recombination protein pif1 [Coprinopsis cinerea okayama7\|eukprot:XP_002912149.1 DNA repair and recombination protein pif1 [Coprinopsis cinerea okayama7\